MSRVLLKTRANAFVHIQRMPASSLRAHVRYPSPKLHSTPASSHRARKMHSTPAFSLHAASSLHVRILTPRPRPHSEPATSLHARPQLNSAPASSSGTRLNARSRARPDASSLQNAPPARRNRPAHGPPCSRAATARTRYSRSVRSEGIIACTMVRKGVGGGGWQIQKWREGAKIRESDDGHSNAVVVRN